MAVTDKDNKLGFIPPLNRCHFVGYWGNERTKSFLARGSVIIDLDLLFRQGLRVY